MSDFEWSLVWWMWLDMDFSVLLVQVCFCLLSPLSSTLWGLHLRRVGVAVRTSGERALAGDMASRNRTVIINHLKRLPICAVQSPPELLAPIIGEQNEVQKKFSSMFLPMTFLIKNIHQNLTWIHWNITVLMLMLRCASDQCPAGRSNHGPV